MIPWEKVIDDLKLFWQYPACTEQHAYSQMKTRSNYVGFPWATILDKRVDMNLVAKILTQFLSKDIEYVTCCQHISFRKLKDLFECLNIKTVYTPHKCIGEDSMGSISLLPCPLFAVNIEDNIRNSVFIDMSHDDFLHRDRKYLYSFMGAYQPADYLTDIRHRIFEIQDENAYIQNTGDWHFNELVYSHSQNYNKDVNESEIHKKNTEDYNHILLDSRFSLCPSGSGPNSIRFWESLAVGAIPILLSDSLELPKNELWDLSIIRISESDLKDLSSILAGISNEDEISRRKNCLNLYQFYKDNYHNNSLYRPIIHYCCGSYLHTGSTGGVARYDYQISKVFPERLFLEGPRQKKQLLGYLNYCKDLGLSPIVITDNHLSCDIPNEYDIFLVHHGCAKTHAIREPGWDPYWRDLCCSGQEKMLTYRDPKTTKIISISGFCTHEFLEHYKDDYRKFDIIKILHSSELDESRVKRGWNDTPIVLGNWVTPNKGSMVVDSLTHSSKFQFQKLNVRLTTAGLRDYQNRKQEIYLSTDIFLQLSLCEGNSYAALDALMMGIPVVSTNTGVFFNDIPEDCFVKIEWKRNQDLAHILEKLEYAWENKEELSRNARKWYLKNCNFDSWKNTMTNIILGEDYGH